MNGSSGFRRGTPPTCSASSGQPRASASTDMSSALRYHPAMAQYYPRLESLVSSLYGAGELTHGALAASRLLSPHLSTLQAAVAAASTIPQPGLPRDTQPSLLPHFNAAAMAAAAAAAASTSHSLSGASSHPRVISPFLYRRPSSPGQTAGAAPLPIPLSQSAASAFLAGHSRHQYYRAPAQSQHVAPSAMVSHFRHPAAVSTVGPALPLVPGPTTRPTPARSSDTSSVIYDRSLSESEIVSRSAASGTGSTVVTARAPDVSPKCGRQSTGTNIRRMSMPMVADTKQSVPSNTKQLKIAGSLPTQPYYPSHFMKGTVIQLANGQLKRVEDLSTEDFVKSADLTGELKIDASRVTNIEEKSTDIALVTFAVGKDKVKVSVEASMEHPFFVVDQGWSAYSPERSRVLYGLSCRQLQIGDVCISLTHRDVADRGTAWTATSSSRSGANEAVGTSSQPASSRSPLLKLGRRSASTVDLEQDERTKPMKKRRINSPGQSTQSASFGRNTKILRRWSSDSALGAGKIMPSKQRRWSVA